jgi:hypothetical protein
MAADYTKRDERIAETVRRMKDRAVKSALSEAICCVCDGVATVEVNKYPNVKFYCEAHLPENSI